MDMIPRRLSALYQQWSGMSPTSVQRIAPSSGSHRQYYRLEGAKGTVIGTYYRNLAENQTFLYYSRHFFEQELPVPQILAVAEDELFYLQEDLGDETLYQYLGKSDWGTSDSFLRSSYRQVVEALAHFQVHADKGLDYSRSASSQRFDRQSMLWDLAYFKYYYLKLLDFPFDETQLERDFQALADWLEGAGPQAFMHRDFQSRNIMLVGGELRFIDYQGGRKGPMQYDLASLLWQAKAQISPSEREQLLQHYLETASGIISIDPATFKAYYYGIVLLRTLQVLGAYGLRGLIEQKSHFLESIPLALENVRWLLSEVDWPVRLPELMKVLHQVVENPPVDTLTTVANESSPLTVTVQSFSFKEGVPVDDSGHGGGHVFDCRALPNPGREKAYKTQTGRDRAVIDYLEAQPETHQFKRSAFHLVDQSVQNYLERSFSSLTVNFGCTGGQHRSVYMADQLAAHLEAKFKVRVRLRHVVQERKSWINEL
jgi:aminoglycoside/choline kinase family phosphotransferase